MDKRGHGDSISREEHSTVTFIVQQVRDTERVKRQEREKS